MTTELQELREAFVELRAVRELLARMGGTVGAKVEVRRPVKVEARAPWRIERIIGPEEGDNAGQFLSEYSLRGIHAEREAGVSWEKLASRQAWTMWNGLKRRIGAERLREKFVSQVVLVR